MLHIGVKIKTWTSFNLYLHIQFLKQLNLKCTEYIKRCYVIVRAKAFKMIEKPQHDAKISKLQYQRANKKQKTNTNKIVNIEHSW
jgi:hypothetical protein